MITEDSSLKLFLLKFFFKDPGLSRLANYGDNLGEVFDSTEIVVGFSPQDVIDKKCEEMEREIKKKYELRADVIADRKPKPLLFFLPRFPEQKEKWSATEIKVLGCKITVEKAD